MDFEPILLEPTRNGQPWAGNSVYGTQFLAVNTSSVGRFKEKLSPEALACLERELGGYLSLLGYLPAGGQELAPSSRTMRLVRYELWKERLAAKRPRVFALARAVRQALAPRRGAAGRR